MLKWRSITTSLKTASAAGWASSNCQLNSAKHNKLLRIAGRIEIGVTLGRRTMATVGKFTLREVKGDLFSAPPNHSLAHCVASDFGMFAGIAVKFKQIYGQVDKLLQQGIQTGGVAVLEDKERYIYYLVTKPQSSDSPTYESLRSSLTAMRDHLRLKCVTKLAIPRIGCGIDGLEWDKVSAELTGVFGDEHLEIVVYNFVPQA